MNTPMLRVSLGCGAVAQIAPVGTARHWRVACANSRRGGAASEQRCYTEPESAQTYEFLTNEMKRRRACLATAVHI